VFFNYFGECLAAKNEWREKVKDFNEARKQANKVMSAILY